MKFKEYIKENYKGSDHNLIQQKKKQKGLEYKGWNHYTDKQGNSYQWDEKVKDFRKNEEKKEDLKPLSDEQLKRTKDSLIETQKLLDKEMSYSKDLRKIDKIDFYNAHIKKLKDMIDKGWNGKINKSK